MLSVRRQGSMAMKTQVTPAQAHGARNAARSGRRGQGEHDRPACAPRRSVTSRSLRRPAGLAHARAQAETRP